MKTRMGLIGSGLMGQHHLRTILASFPDTDVALICEPSTAAYEVAAQLCIAAGRPVPRHEPDFATFIQNYDGSLDAAFIVTPHALHHEQTKACLEAGLDVLLEKPMVMSVAEAESLIDVRDRTGRELVVAFQGSLSPQVRAAVAMLRSGAIGSILNINGTIWQDWDLRNAGTWRQQEVKSGGGFLFDTGAHLLNTICDLAGQPFVQVAAWLDNRNRPVDLLGAVIGRLASGALVTINACGDTIPSCSSEILVFCESAILRTGAWGRVLDVQYEEEEGWQAVEVPASRGVWEQFLAVRSGELANPSPAEVGLRMVHLWNAIKKSSSSGGAPVAVGEGQFSGVQS